MSAGAGAEPAGPAVGVAVPAAGEGRRLGGRRKPFLELEGEPVLLRSLRPFLEHPDVVSVVVALPADDAAEPPPWLAELAPRVRTVPGGATRADSVRAAVEALPPEVEVVMVHDAARPLVDRGLVERCLEVARRGEGAVAGLPAVDTLKEVDAEGRIVGQPERSRIWHAQTPQAFPREVLERAFREAGPMPPVTDDAGLVQRIGAAVRMVRGSPRNLKITLPDDLAVAALHLRRAPRVLHLPGGAPAGASAAGPSDLDEALAPVLTHLREGGLLAYPTETVYGLGGLARPEPVEALRRLKGREEERPFLVLLPDADAARPLRWTPAARTLADRFWPGPLTLVLADPDSRFPPGVRSPAGTVAVRVSPHPLASALVRALGEPLTSTSANVPGADAARSGDAALAAVEALGGDERVWIVDVGTLPPSEPSTLVDCSGGPPSVLREGALSARRIEEALEESDARE